ncbi:tetratricopeptide repeat-containing protein [Massilia sp. AB1]|uniref:tetratricopeptide repeat-containing protein n=1 Tax=Massilia sp. AB1 TaxID=2823371 RepID=UPI001B82F495|nr:tetratricopeptide repeat-containing protein [Massilia sp. AB1]MBQ5943020.1 tetratricopeptide repeat-containing protein [Massilia sp. AB1]
MEHNRIPLPPLVTPGEVTTFYAYEGGAARNAMLSALALQLAGAGAGAPDRTRAGSPVLMIDWDLDAPALHRHFELSSDGEEACAVLARPDADCDADPGLQPGAEGEAGGETQRRARPGLVDFFEACRTQLRREASQPTGAGSDEALAERVLDAIDWQNYVERADQRRPLYLMRAGRFDGSYAERAGRLDWEALFDACPALFRRFGARMARHFSHVLVASRPGRSPAVSVCTTLLADRLVGLFTPSPGSLDGFEGAVRRAIEYRCTHEDEQRPLLVYPLACAPDGARSDPHQRWRRGDARLGAPGYQPRIEVLLRACYGWPRVNLDSYFDELQLPLADAMSTADPGTDRRALARFAGVLAEWVAPGRFPWQSLDEIRLRAAVARARPAHSGAEFAAHARELADSLARLGGLCRREGRFDEARACLEECLALREDTLDKDHPAVRAARADVALLLLDAGALPEARRQYELLGQSCARSVGADDPETLSARSRLARVLAGLGEAERALALHEQVVAACERALGDEHPATLDSLEDLAISLTQQHEYGRARIVCERVLEGRRRQLGAEHEDTLRCGQRLAQLLGEMGELGNARRLLEAVLRARERHDGPDAAGALGAREALAEILAAQGDLAAVRSIQESLARTRERHLGAGHPETLDMQLRLASTLGQQGETEAARRLREQVAELRRHLEQAEGIDLQRSEAEDRQQREHGHRQGRGEGVQVSDSLGHKLAQLQNLIDSRSPREARALADSLRNTVLRPSVADPLRRRGAAMIKQVYLQDGDKDALLSFTQDEVSSLEGALIEAARDNPVPSR